MKKWAFFLVLLIIPAFSCFAGSFYSNIVVLSVDVQNFVTILLQMGITSYYVLTNNIAVIYEKRLDDQDTDYGINLTKNITKNFNSITVYTTIHDSDIVLMYIYKNDELIFLYNSKPGYFNGKDIPPKIENIDKLLEEFPFVTKEEIMNVLTSDETFADDLHKNIVEILKLPLHSVGFGYNYINDIEERKYFENTFNVKIETIGE